MIKRFTLSWLFLALSSGVLMAQVDAHGKTGHWTLIPTSSSRSEALSFSLSLPASRIEFSDDNLHSFQGAIQNTTSKRLNFAFRRHQALPDSDWSTSVCFGPTCFPSSADSASAPFDAGELKGLILDINNPLRTVKDSARITLQIYVSGGNPADTQSISFIAVFVPTNTVQSKPEHTGELQIGQVWPMPARSGADVSLKVESLSTDPCSLSIFSEGGSLLEVAQLGLMNSGITERTMHLTNLAAGNYFMALNQSGKRSKSALLQVLR